MITQLDHFNEIKKIYEKLCYRTITIKNWVGITGIEGVLNHKKASKTLRLKQYQIEELKLIITKALQKYGGKFSKFPVIWI